MLKEIVVFWPFSFGTLFNATQQSLSPFCRIMSVCPIKMLVPNNDMNITHIAWLGRMNYGDDVMAEAMRFYLGKKYKNIKYKIWCEGKPDTSKNINWIYPFELRHNRIKKIFQKNVLKKTDLLVIGGGSILHSLYSISWKQWAVNYIRKVNKNAIIVGVNLSIGPFPDMVTKVKCHEFLDSLDVASFRDSESFDFARAKVSKYFPIKSFDLAASYLKMNNLKIYNRKDIKTIGIALKEVKDSEEAFRKHVRLLKRLSNRYERIILFSFCGHKKHGDYQYGKKLSDRVNSKNIQQIRYNNDHKMFTNKINNCDFFISTPLHGIIVPFLLNIPFISVSYHIKCNNFLNYIKLPRKYIFNHDCFDVE